MVASPALGLDITSIGVITSIFPLCYGCSKFVSGVVGDVLSPSIMLGGGLSAVIWTDFVQTILMIIGAVWLMIMSFTEVGGYEQLIDKYLEAVPDPEYVSTYNDSVTGNDLTVGYRTIQNFTCHIVQIFTTISCLHCL